MFPVGIQCGWIGQHFPKGWKPPVAEGNVAPVTIHRRDEGIVVRDERIEDVMIPLLRFWKTLIGIQLICDQKRYVEEDLLIVLRICVEIVKVQAIIGVVILDVLRTERINRVARLIVVEVMLVSLLSLRSQQRLRGERPEIAFRQQLELPSKFFGSDGVKVALAI